MSLSLQHIETNFLRLCFERELPMDAIAEFAGPKEGWELYRRMARHRLRKMIGSASPRSKNEIGEAGFDKLFSDFLAERAPQTPFLLDVPSEFAAYTLSLASDALVESKYLRDLIRYEQVVWHAAFVEVHESGDIVGFDFEKAIVLNPTCVFLQLDYPVHQKDAGNRQAKPSSLCVFRSMTTHRVHTWLLSPIMMDLLQAWQADASKPASDAVRSVLAKRNESISQGFIEKLCDTLAKFMEQGIVLGSRA
ncbi:MAG: putative DNA-binding domain-containing protein [Myxococcales bacterium]|nr:MAG: putative DNA-binding domain-containing protein [Myxococcales bacterium]